MFLSEFPLMNTSSTNYASCYRRRFLHSTVRNFRSVTHNITQLVRYVKWLTSKRKPEWLIFKWTVWAPQGLHSRKLSFKSNTRDKISLLSFDSLLFAKDARDIGCNYKLTNFQKIQFFLNTKAFKFWNRHQTKNLNKEINKRSSNMVDAFGTMLTTINSIDQPPSTTNESNGSILLFSLLRNVFCLC